MDKLKNNYKYNISAGLLGAFVGSSASFLAAYLKILGGNDFHYALLNSLPAFFAVFALIPGAILIDSTKNKLRTALVICFLSRAFFLLYALVPLLPKELQAISLVALMGLRNAPEAVWGIGYQSLIADAFPLDKLNEVIGLRNKYNSILTVIATFLLGLYLALNETFPISNILLYILLFSFTFIIGLIEIFHYSKFKIDNNLSTNTENTEEPKESFAKKLKLVVRSLPQNKGYLKYCLTIMIFYIGWQMAWPLYNIYMLNTLNANSAWVGYINITSTITQILTINMWIRLSNTIGDKKVLGICMFLMALSPAMYAISPNLPVLLALQVVVGSGMSGVITLTFNELIFVCPEKNRTIYISLFTCLTQITSTFMPFVGIWFKEAFSIYIALYASTILRSLGAIVFLIAFRKKRSHNYK